MFLLVLGCSTPLLDTHGARHADPAPYRAVGACLALGCPSKLGFEMMG